MTVESITQELKPLIIRSLRITGMSPEDLSDDQALLGGDLEIDSIDILQLIVEIEKRYSIKLIAGKFDREAWTSIASLAGAIHAKIG